MAISLTQHTDRVLIIKRTTFNETVPITTNNQDKRCYAVNPFSLLLDWDQRCHWILYGLEEEQC